MPETPGRRAELVALGQVLRTSRVERGWTLGDLAAATKISRRFISKIENGHANPSVASLLTLAEALGTRASDFLRLAEVDPGDP